MSKNFRFGVMLPGVPSSAEWASWARQAEDLGYDIALIPDHFGEQLAPVPALMAAASATTTLRIGTLVLGNDYSETGEVFGDHGAGPGTAIDPPFQHKYPPLLGAIILDDVLGNLG